MKTLFALALLLAVPAAWGQANPRITVSGNQQLASVVEHIADGLNASLPQWSIVILTEHQWREWQKWGPSDSKEAFSLLGANRTYLREECARNRHRLAFVLAHEAGHLICNCSSENGADYAARRLRQIAEVQ